MLLCLEKSWVAVISSLGKVISPVASPGRACRKSWGPRRGLVQYNVGDRKTDATDAAIATDDAALSFADNAIAASGRTLHITFSSASTSTVIANDYA